MNAEPAPTQGNELGERSLLTITTPSAAPGEAIITKWRSPTIGSLSSKVGEDWPDILKCIQRNDCLAHLMMSYIECYVASVSGYEPVSNELDSVTDASPDEPSPADLRAILALHRMSFAEACAEKLHELYGQRHDWYAMLDERREQLEAIKENIPIGEKVQRVLRISDHVER